MSDKDKNYKLGEHLKETDDTPVKSGNKLSDDDLEIVSGGVTIVPYEDEFKKEITKYDYITGL